MNKKKAMLNINNRTSIRHRKKVKLYYLQENRWITMLKKKVSQKTQIQMSHNFSHKWKSILYVYVCVDIKKTYA